MERIADSTHVWIVDTRISVGVTTREGAFIAARGRTSLRATDRQLYASRVELRTALAHGILKRYELSAKQVIAWSKVTRDGDCRWGPRLWNIGEYWFGKGDKGLTDICLVPGCVTRLETQLRNFEPLGIGGIVACAGTIAQGHVVHDRTRIVGPLDRGQHPTVYEGKGTDISGVTANTTDPVNLDGAAGVSISDVGSQLGTLATVEIWVCSILDGTVCVDLTNNRLDRRSGPDRIALVDCAVDRDLVDITVR